MSKERRMKRQVAIVIFLLISLGELQAQIVGRLFYNKDWKLTRRDSAVYFRVVVIDTASQTFVGPVKDFTKDGKLIMTGSYSGGKRNGAFVGYYRDGKKEWEGSYQDNNRVGPWTYYYPNGAVRTEVTFDAQGMLPRRHLDSLGHILLENGTGRWTEKYYESPGVVVTVSGEYKQSYSDGTWTWAMDDGTVWCAALFNLGRLVKGTIVADSISYELGQYFPDEFPDHYKHYYTEQFAMHPGVLKSDYPFLKGYEELKGGEVFTIVELSAHPVGGMVAFYKDVANQLSGAYPKDARQRGIEGRVFVEFIVEKDGSLRDFQVIKGVYPSLDELAVRVVQQSQLRVKWVPGIQRRHRVRQKYTLPIIFKLG